MKPILFAAFAAALLAAPAAVLAQPAAAPHAQAPQCTAAKPCDITDDASPWINDPNIHDFYKATVDAFAAGPDHLDRDAYDKRAREIFHAFALAHGMSPDALQDHVKAIPGEVVQIVTRDPRTLDSYDTFVVALFGPQKSGPGSRP